MKVGDLVMHIDRKDFGIVTHTRKIHGRNREIRVFWSDGDTKDYQSDYYLRELI